MEPQVWQSQDSTPQLSEAFPEDFSKKPSRKTSERESSSPVANRIFNQADRFAQGWYWAMRSHTLKPNSPQSLTLLGRDLVLYRNVAGNPVALDAQCAHCAHCAHLSGGLAKGEEREGPPCVETAANAWPTAERYGLVWVWIGQENAAVGPLPHVPELGDRSCDFVLSDRFTRKCHPNVLLINAIDAHHFNSVHNLPLDIRFDMSELGNAALQFNNVTRGGEASRFVQLIRPFYQEEVTYRLCYWYGSTGTVTLGPDFLHFYLMFTLRPGPNGITQGQMVLLTPKRSGLFGWLFNRSVLGVTQLVASYFAKGDRLVFDSIRFNLKVPLEADRAILQFIKHVDRQPALTWKTWSS